MRSSSSTVNYFFSIGTGSLAVSSDVTHGVVSSTNESPFHVLVLLLPTETKVMHSIFPPNAVIINWLKRAHMIGDLQLPFPIPYSNFLKVLLYIGSEIPHPVEM
jgi:hypothetical protein